MGRKNPIEDANLLYVSFIIITILLITMLFVEETRRQGEVSNLQTEKTLSNIEVDLISCNNFEITIKLTNNRHSVVEMKDFSFYFENEKVNPKLSSVSSLEKGESGIVKLDRRKGKLKIFYKGILIYSYSL